MVFDHPIWYFLGSCVEIISLTRVPDCPGPPDIFFLCHLTHIHGSHYQDIYLAINQTLVHMPTCYLQMLLFRSLFWSLQAISPKDCSQMVLPWWKIWCLPHLHYCGSPWWMVYFPYWMMIPSILFQAFLDPHKKANYEANISSVYTFLGLCMVPFFLIPISGLLYLFYFTYTVSLLPQGLMCQILSWTCLCCVAPCVSASF